MGSFFEYFYEFFMYFLTSIWEFVKNIFVNLWDIFNVAKYAQIFSDYMGGFNALGWILAILSVILFLGIVGVLIWMLVVFIRKRVMAHRKFKKKEALIEQVDELNRQVIKLMDEKDKIMAMKVSQIGIRPGEETAIESGAAIQDGEGRFIKLMEVDKKYFTEPFEITDPQNFTLKDIVHNFRHFACSKLRLYYDEKTIITFLAGMATSRIIILEGISGTGKTSLPYAMGKFLKHDSSIVAVQPSWRDKTELIGYLNEFTKRFNETDFLKSVYDAAYRTDVGFVVLDEMNLARIEYYFAEILSVLEMPNRDEWRIDVVPDQWDSDPRKLKGGKLKFPTNLWFVGTANNDDSTFTITDKVYDRAVTIQLNSKGVAFECEQKVPMQIEASYLEELFGKAKIDYEISKENLEKFDDLDNYIITNFRLAFGNRILKQILDFVPVYVACGGTELDGLDYMLTYKILRKLEGLNISFAQENLKKLVAYVDKLFGKKEMNETRNYLNRLLKSAGI